MIDLTREPTRRELAWFGLGLGGVLVVLGLLLWPKLGFAVTRGVWVAAAALVVVFYAIPPLRRPIYVGWMYLVFPIAWTVSHVLLALVYYLVLTPIGILRRVIGGDPLHRAIDRDASTYWVERHDTKPLSRYFRGF